MFFVGGLVFGVVSVLGAAAEECMLVEKGRLFWRAMSWKEACAVVNCRFRVWKGVD